MSTVKVTTTVTITHGGGDEYTITESKNTHVSDNPRFFGEHVRLATLDVADRFEAPIEARFGAKP